MGFVYAVILDNRGIFCLEVLPWVWDFRSYSTLLNIPDLVPSDYHVFGPLKGHFERALDEATESVNFPLKAQPKTFFSSDRMNLVQQCEKCIERG